jgi:hypothetical protein
MDLVRWLGFFLHLTSNLLLAYFTYVEKLKLGLCDHYAVCVSPLLSNFLLRERIFMKLGMYDTSARLSGIFHSTSHQSVFIYVFPYRC